jgi:hypothetical protein
MHLEDSEWTRLALGAAAHILASLGRPTTVDVVQLEPDSVTVRLAAPATPQWPFNSEGTTNSWTLPRDPNLIASLPVTKEITRASQEAALVTISELHGRRSLVDLVAVGSTILKGALPAVGVKVADLVAELGSRRWSDVGTLVLVAFDKPMPRLEGASHASDIAAALQELKSRPVKGAGPRSTCVIVPPWASEPADPCLGELIRFCETAADVGVLCCASLEGARCVWELDPETPGRTTLTFSDRLKITSLDVADQTQYFKSSGQVRQPARSNHRDETTMRSADESAARPTSAQPRDRRASPTPLSSPVEVTVLGNIKVNGAPESFGHRRRMTELVAFLAMHPEGATSDAFAAALWSGRLVPLQTLANRLSETRKALGLASDGRPRLRKRGGRHLIVEVETDWDRFRSLIREESDADSWRKALALVRGRPFADLDKGE